jgi:hypothetical protein
MLVDRDKAIEACAKVAESIWDNVREGAHGGEQANRTAAAIRQLTLEDCRVEVDKAVLEQLRNDVIESLSAQVAELRKERDVQSKLVGEQAADLVKCHWQVAELRKHERRLKAMLPLFEEARDALTAIPLASAKLHGLRLDLGVRMDDVGVMERWESIDAAKESGNADAG